MRSWVSLLSLLLCVISFSMLHRGTTTDPASGTGIRGTFRDREAPDTRAAARVQGAATAEEWDSRRLETQPPDDHLTMVFTRLLAGFEGTRLEVYFQPDALRIGGRARISARP